MTNESTSKLTVVEAKARCLQNHDDSHPSMDDCIIATTIDTHNHDDSHPSMDDCIIATTIDTHNHDCCDDTNADAEIPEAPIYMVDLEDQTVTMEQDSPSIHGDNDNDDATPTILEATAYADSDASSFCYRHKKIALILLIALGAVVSVTMAVVMTSTNDDDVPTMQQFPRTLPPMPTTQYTRRFAASETLFVPKPTETTKYVMGSISSESDCAACCWRTQSRAYLYLDQSDTVGCVCYETVGVCFMENDNPKIKNTAGAVFVSYDDVEPTQRCT